MKRILLVEDNPADVLLTLRVFSQANIEAEIVVAEDGVVALEMLAEPEAMDPVLILMDINMPRKNGKDVLKEIKATTRFRHIPVVMLTTSDARVLRKLCEWLHREAGSPRRIHESSADSEKFLV